MDFLYKTKYSMQNAIKEVIQAETLTLMPNSITVSPFPVDLGYGVPFATNRITIDIQYATTIFSVVVTLDNPLDFIIKSKSLLPLRYLDHKIPPGQ